MSRTTEIMRLLQAAKTVLGENSNNRPAPDELEKLHDAIYQFEQGQAAYSSEPTPNVSKQVTASDPTYVQFLTLRGWANTFEGHYLEKKKSIELTHLIGGDVEIKIPCGADLTNAAELLRAAAEWLDEYRDFLNLEKSELTAEQLAHNVEVQNALLPF